MTDQEHPYRLDTDKQIFFYENDFYVLSNFSAFQIVWEPHLFPTSEHVYQWSKFNYFETATTQRRQDIRRDILTAKSAHEAFKIAQREAALCDPCWPSVRVPLMKAILRTKADQHEYVKRKLLQTGDRELIEDSWRDSFWGWGRHRDGQNMLGILWMEIRQELRESHD